MFLNMLNEEQKDLFLDLCIHASNANNEVTDEELDTIFQYCDEMKVIDYRTEAISPIENVISELAQISSKSELKAIAIEIIALMISDSKNDDFEKNFISEFFEKAQIQENEQNEILDLLNELTTVYAKISQFIND